MFTARQNCQSKNNNKTALTFTSSTQRQRQISLVYIEFQISQSYTVRSCQLSKLIISEECKLNRELYFLTH